MGESVRPEFVMPPYLSSACPGSVGILVSLILLVLPFAVTMTAEAAPHKSRPHVAAKPPAKKVAVKERRTKRPAIPSRVLKGHGAVAPRPAMATEPAMAPSPPSRSARLRRSAATIRDPGIREEARMAQVACERDGRIYLLQNCTRSDPPDLRSTPELAEAR